MRKNINTGGLRMLIIAKRFLTALLVPAVVFRNIGALNLFLFQK